MEPTSWAEDLQMYHAARTRGPAAAAEPVVSFGRTRLAKFADPVFSVGAEAPQPYPVGTLEVARYKRHGWGNYASEQKLFGQLDPGPPPKPERRRITDVAACISTAGKTIHMLHPAGPNVDRWIGHVLIDPSKGRHKAENMDEAAGRDSFFDIVNQRNASGDRMGPEKDSWLGNRLVDPTKGKGYVPDPALAKEGRAGLFGVIATHDVPTGGADGDPALLDSWIGHVRIDPHKGRSSAGYYAQTQRLSTRAVPIASLIQMDTGPLPAGLPLARDTVRMSPRKYRTADVRACLQWVPPDAPPPAAGRRKFPAPLVVHHSWPARQDFAFAVEGEIGRAAKGKVYPVPGTRAETQRSAKMRSVRISSAMGDKATMML